MKKAIISGKNIGIGYGKSNHRNANVLYDNLSFDLYQGELTCLLGANGAGKSTLLRTISGNQLAINGNIFFKEKDITSYKERYLSQLLGLVLTDKTNVGGLTVRELVSLGRYPYTGFFGKLTEKDKKIVEESMTDVGILYKAESYMAELSDGERQKTMIAKAICQECPVLLLDEPTAFLDVKGRIEIMDLLHKLSSKHNKTILLSTHDIDLALRLADRLWLLSTTKGLISGITEDLILSNYLDDFFEGDKIEFRKESGNFYPKENKGKEIYLDADGILFYWTKNMLNRNGFQVSESPIKSNISVQVSGLNKICVSDGVKKEEFYDFESLSNWIQSI